jgi:exonuclease SbcC
MDIYEKIERVINDRFKKIYAQIKDNNLLLEENFNTAYVSEENGNTDAWREAFEKRDTEPGLLLDVLEQEIKELEIKKNEEKKIIDKKNADIVKLVKRISDADKINSKFGQRKEAVLRYESLMEQKETYDNKAVILKKAKAAGEVRQVQSVYIKTKNTIELREKQLEQNKSKFVLLEQSHKKLLSEKESFEKSYLTDNEKLLKEKNRLENEMEKYKVYDEKNKLYILEEKKLKELKEKSDLLNDEKKAALIKSEENKKILLQLKDIELELQKYIAADENEKRNLKEFEALKKAIASYKKENSRLDSAEKEYADKYLAWKEARKTYENTSDRYVAAQAAILAAGLKDGMPCPVCGSTNHTQPAAMTKDTVTKEELDGAKSKENECEKEKNNSQKIFEDNKRKKDVAFAEVKRYYEICYYLGDKADTSLKDKKGYNASIKDKTDTDIKEHENIRQQENIKDKEYTSFGENKTDKLEENVKTKIKEIKKSLTENEQTIEDLYSKKEEKLKREKAEKETEAKLKEMEENISDNAEMLNKQSVSVGSLSAEMEMLKKELSYESSDTALKELENIRNKIEVLEKRKRELDENILKSDRTKSNLNGTIKENKNQLETDRKNLETEYDDFIKVLKEKEFENEEAYNESLVHIESIEIFDRQIQEYKEEVSKVSSLISVLDDMLDGEKEIDTDVMLQQKAEMEIEAERLANENEITVSKLGTNNSVRDKVSKLMEQRGKLNEKYKIISSLNNVANSKKIHFQTFVLRQYFNMVISYANKRLAVMTSNGLLLKCRDISLTTAGETGLELDVYSPVTGKVRDAHSLSGGETFMASLAMALGMSDIVQNNSGKTQIDTMFIDEGFGSLSDDVRDKAVKILLDLAGSSRLVGVISHVSELKEQIPSKIIVRKDNDGSHITWVQDR